MTPDLTQLIHAFRTPLQLNARRGERILILTDARMDERLWQALMGAANELGMEPMVAIMNARVTHSTNPPDTLGLRPGRTRSTRRAALPNARSLVSRSREWS